jgi:hypothetical protein
MDGKLGEPVGAAKLFGRGKGGGGIEILDFGCDLAVESGGIE